MAQFFLPPNTTVLPPEPRLQERGIHSRKYRRLLWTRKGSDLDGFGGVTVAGIKYQGGRWSGPLTSQQVSDLTAAGYGGRIVTAVDEGHLPSGID